MASAGMRNIQIANEVVDPNKIMRLVALSEKCKITIAVDNRENVELISRVMREHDASMDVLIDIDVGLHRCGLSISQPNRIARFAKFLDSQSGIEFKGIMTHAGQVYRATTAREVKEIGLFEGKKMVELANLLKREAKVRCETVSVGSTPTARYAGSVRGVTEIRPGNYVFNDNIQVSMGTANVADCALRVLSSVVSIPTKSRVIVDAGSKSLGTERVPWRRNSLRGYGQILNKKALIRRLSDEHGFIGDIQKGERFALGERILIIPNHACFTVNLYDKIIGTDGREFEIAARGCNQ
jgi:D-serine deaminase-like pyridoxal phosphate-dependent protein